MKKIKFFFAVLSLLVGSVTMFAQNITVTGKVTDAVSGEPVPFAAIQLKDTMTGASSDENGSFSIMVPSDGILVFSSIGYVNSEVAIDGRAVINIQLHPDSELIDETIVVAFGTATKESFTGSAAVVKSSDIAKVQSTDVTRAIEGVVAGVQMTTSSGSFDVAPSLRIRGIGTISSQVNAEPLYVIDGVPYSGNMNNINPSDIETMTVLKDAASNALYGSRGANGVIMITTKKGRSGEAVINVDAKWGINSKALQNYDYITDPATYYETHYRALYNYYVNANGLTPEAASARASANVAGSAANGGLGYLVYTVPEGQAFIGTNGKINPNATLGRTVTYNGKDYLLYPDDWMDEAYKQSLRQEYNVSVSGSTEKSSFYASFGYLNNKGIIDGADMYRYTARLKADYQAKRWLKIGANAGYTNYNYNNGNSEEGASGSTGNIFSFTSSMAPIYPLYVRDANGNIMIDQWGLEMYDYGDGMNAGMSRPNAANSNAVHAVTLDKNNSEGNAINGTGYAEVSFLKDFKFTFNAGVGVDELRGTSLSNMYYGQYAPAGGSIYKSHGRSFYLNLQQLLNWSRTFGGVHNVSVLLGHESYKSASYSLSGYKTKLFSMDNMELNGAVVDGQSSSSSMSTYNNEGYFIRAQYDFSNRIFVSASYRRDASSRFHPDHRWGNFWSVGAGWLINEESWFDADWVDMLKLKASIGSQGNDGIGNYLYTDTYSISNNEGEIAVTFVNKGNPDITWETNTNFNAGFDFGLWGSRLSGTAEYFYRKTSDMLFWFSVPASLGYSGYYDNIGDMRNSGVELSLNATAISTRNFTWDIYANFTHYTNKITMLPDERKTRNIEGYEGYANGNKYVGEGLPLNTFFLPEYAGIDKTNGLPQYYMDELDEKGNVVGRTVTTEYSKATNYLCDDPTPKLYGGFGTSLSFYGFDVAASFTYSIGGKTYDSGYASLVTPPGGSLGFNYHKDVLKAWSPENPDSDFPRWQYNDQNFNGASTRFLVDASYLNFQNAQVGYTLPKKITRKFFVDKLRIYIACDNIVYWSYRHGLDPRFSFDGETNDAVNSPIRTLSGGINITF